MTFKGFVPQWIAINSWWVFGDLKLIQSLEWRSDWVGSKSAKTSALMIFMALSFFSEPEDEDELIFSESEPNRIVSLTYTSLQELTGLSRKLIREGILVLESLDVLSYRRDGNKNIYILKNKRMQKGGWSKLPVRSLLSKDRKSITPLHLLDLRSKSSLHALKIFYYLVASRFNERPYVEASYSKLSNELHLSNSDIKKAITILCTIDLIDHVKKEQSNNGPMKEPNKYFLSGYLSLTTTKKN